MSVPFYASPEQITKDKADFARKGIARGRSVVVTQYDDGILFVAENPSRTLHKVSEIYDRIAFAAVGKYNEFESLRVGGIRLADMRGFSYDRADVTGRSLANAYATSLGTIFTEAAKPYEVELVVAEVGDTPDGDQMYRLRFDGSVADERGFVVMGGSAEELSERMRSQWHPGLSRGEALRMSVRALRSIDPNRQIPVDQLEVAVLDRNRAGRRFARLSAADLTAELADQPSQNDDAGSARASDESGSAPGESGAAVGESGGAAGESGGDVGVSDETLGPDSPQSDT